MKIKESDLKYFAGCALTGLSSNPFLMSPEGKMHLTRNNLSIEKLAMNSALEMIARCEQAREVMDRLEAEEKSKEPTNGTDETPNTQPSGGAQSV